MESRTREDQRYRIHIMQHSYYLIQLNLWNCHLACGMATILTES
jgi:hypothetical protein